MNAKTKRARRFMSLLARNAYIRRPNLGRKKKEDYTQYKKGHELRLPVNFGHVQKVREALLNLGFSPAKTFKKHSRYIVPIYGFQQVTRFKKMFRLHP